MDAYMTVAEIKRAILDIKEATDRAIALIASLNQDASMGSETTTTTLGDLRACGLEPGYDPNPIHPNSAGCWLQYPLTVGDVNEPIQSIGGMLRIVLAGLDGVDPNTPLPPNQRR